MDRLRIVLVTPKAPAPFGSTPTNWYYLVARGLAERGHQVTCLSVYEQPHEVQRAQEALADVDLTLKLERPEYILHEWGTFTTVIGSDSDSNPRWSWEAARVAHEDKASSVTVRLMKPGPAT